MFHVKQLGFLGLAVAVAACDQAADALFSPSPSTPQEIAPGIFRLTTSTSPDHVRGVLRDGSVVYRAPAVAGLSITNVLAVIHPDSAAASEAAGPYRSALASELVDAFVELPEGRFLRTLTIPESRSHWCGDPAPAPAYAGWSLYALPAVDGDPIASLPRSGAEFPIFMGQGRDPQGALSNQKRIRLVPAVAEAESLGTDPWGSSVTAGGEFAYLSDGETIWRVAPDLSVAPVPITTGAYPQLSPDETEIVFSRASITDSVVQTDVVVWTPFLACTQDYVTYSISGWTVVRRSLITGAEDTLGAGIEASWLSGDTLVVRRQTGLYMIDLSGGSETLLTDLPGITSPHVSPQYRFVAFSATQFGNADVFILRLD